MKKTARGKFLQAIQSYNQNNLIQHLSLLSIECFVGSSNKIASTAIHDEFVLPQNPYKKYPVIITPWSLVDITYYAAFYCNNRNVKKLDSRSELLFIINAYNGFHAEEEKEHTFMKNNKNGLSTDFLLYLYGFFGEQSRFQKVNQVFENYCREKYIMTDISSSFKDDINVEQNVFSEIGISSKMVDVILFYLWGLLSATKSSNVNSTEISREKIPEDAIEVVLDYYSIEISQLWETGLGRQIFYSKPFIKTENNNYICTNVFLLLFAFENSSYWIVRNHWLALNRQDFINAFGQYFEVYAHELLFHYLSEPEFSKIEEAVQKRADWILSLSKYKILIEQKSALAGYKAKQQKNDVNEIKKYIIRNWLDAINQLSATQSHINSGAGEVIKIILSYDNYFKAESLEQAFSLPECKVDDDGYYWLVSIREFEMLLHTYKNNVSLFDSIVDEKIILETKKSRDGRELGMIMERFGITSNEHLNQDKYRQYFNEIEKAVRRAISKKPST